jgi:HlyD family secretion protein
MTGTEMMRIANFNSMEVQVEVSENDILRVSVGDTADIEVDAYLDKKFKGVVTEMASSASNTGTGVEALTSDQVTNFIVKIRILQNSYSNLNDKKMPFRPGMSASVDINTNTERDVVAIPIQAVTTREKDGEKKDTSGVKKSIAKDEIDEVVFVYEADTARMVKVKTGIQDNEYIQVLEGLKVGEEVITGPYSIVSRKLKNGLIVERKKKADKDKKETKDSKASDD